MVSIDPNTNKTLAIKLSRRHFPGVFSHSAIFKKHLLKNEPRIRFASAFCEAGGAAL
jgi:hypothetical protein